jgi:hypothetical protein
MVYVNTGNRRIYFLAISKKRKYGTPYWILQSIDRSLNLGHFAIIERLEYLL